MSSVPISDEQLREAVAESLSWRGVLSHLGLTASSSRRARLLRDRCVALGIPSDHLAGQRRWSDSAVGPIAARSRTWTKLLQDLGYSGDSGSARAIVRAHCERLGVDLTHLGHPASRIADEALHLCASSRHLPSAGSLLVAAFLTLSGHRVCWPLEPAPYDLVVDMGTPPLRRVQVKTTTRRRERGYVCEITRNAYDGASRWRQRQIYFPGEIDYFGIVDGDLNIYLIPFGVLGGRSSASLARYQQFRVGSLPATPGLSA